MALSIDTGAVIPRRGPTAGVLAQVAVLGSLMAGVGLGLTGWLAGTAYAAINCGVLARALGRSGMRTLGPANTVTLARATLVGGVTALVVDARGRWLTVAVLVALASVALLLDGVDGHVARRTGTSSAVGARFDMETDAFLILMLSVFVARSLGPWVLCIGAFRYLFLAAGRWVPWLRAALPPRMSRKAVAVAQGVVLVVASAGVLPSPATTGLVAGALVLLTWSFGHDVRWLWRHRSDQRQDVPEPAGAGPRGVR